MLGVGVLRVPFVGQPIVWIQQQRWLALTLALGAVLAAVVVSTVPAVAPRRTGDVAADGGDPEAEPPAAVATPSTRRGRRIRTRRRRRARLAALLAAGAVLALVVAPATVAHAAFAAASDSRASFATAVATAPSELRCVSNADGTVTISWRHPGGGAGFTTIVDGRAVASSGADARSTTLSVQSLFAWSRQSVTVRSDLGGAWSATSATVPVRVFSFLGLGSVRCA